MRAFWGAKRKQVIAPVETKSKDAGLLLTGFPNMALMRSSLKLSLALVFLE